MGTLTDRPLETSHEETGHDGGPKGGLSDLREHLGCQDFEGTTRFSDHLWFPEDAEHVAHYRIEDTEWQTDVILKTGHEPATGYEQ